MPKDKTRSFTGLISVQRWRGVMTPRIHSRAQHLRFMPQIARTLKADTHALYQNILTLCDLNQSADPDPVYRRILTNLVKSSASISQWGFRFSDDPRSLIWINWSFLRFALQSCLTPIAGYTSFLLNMVDKTGEKMFSLTPHENALLQNCYSTAQRISRNLTHMRSFKIYAYPHDERVYKVAPHVIAKTLWSSLAYSRSCEFAALLPNPLPRLPAVLYHPSLVLHFLHSICLDLEQSEREEPPRRVICMQLRSAEHGAEICLTVQGDHFSLPSWEYWQKSSEYKRLRELGGTIEPLTWDEGYGQGVVMRLPWVKQEKGNS
jgi:hypothetical protein